MVVKEAVISRLGKSGYYTFGFGDRRPNGIPDDQSETNNGDLVKVFATVIHIMEIFLEKKPGCILSFTGSTPQRTMVYNKILKRYYSRFSGKYHLTGFVLIDDEYVEVEYDPAKADCLVFFIKKKQYF